MTDQTRIELVFFCMTNKYFNHYTTDLNKYIIIYGYLVLLSLYILLFPSSILIGREGYNNIRVRP